MAQNQAVRCSVAWDEATRWSPGQTEAAMCLAALGKATRCLVARDETGMRLFATSQSRWLEERKVPFVVSCTTLLTAGLTRAATSRPGC